MYFISSNDGPSSFFFIRVWHPICSILCKSDQCRVKLVCNLFRARKVLTPILSHRVISFWLTRDGMSSLLSLIILCICHSYIALIFQASETWEKVIQRAAWHGYLICKCVITWSQPLNWEIARVLPGILDGSVLYLIWTKDKWSLLRSLWVVLPCQIYNLFPHSYGLSRGGIDKNIVSLTHDESINNSLNADTSKSIHLKISDDISGDKAGSESETDFNLGPTPRSKYPLVILVSLHDEDYETWSHNVSIVSISMYVKWDKSYITFMLHYSVNCSVD